jgi:hypothetical protein
MIRPYASARCAVIDSSVGIVLGGRRGRSSPFA